MQYISTRDAGPHYSASQSIAQGLARDGGLLTPFYNPKLPGKALEDLKGMSYQHRAVYVMKQYLEEFSVKELTDFAGAAYGPDKFDTDHAAPLRGPTDDHRLPAPLRVVELLHRGEERVEVKQAHRRARPVEGIAVAHVIHASIIRCRPSGRRGGARGFRRGAGSR